MQQQIRADRLAALQGLLSDAELTAHGAYFRFCTVLAPSGAAAAVAWQMPHQSSLHLAFPSEVPGEWHVSLDHSGPEGLHIIGARGFSPSGRVLASMHKRLNQGVMGQLYNVQERCWLREVVISRAVQSNLHCFFIQLSSCETLAANVYCEGDRHCLAVYGASQESVRTVPLAGESYGFAWLPCTALIVWSCGSLARVELVSGNASSNRELQPQWVKVCEHYRSGEAHLAVLPSGKAVVTLHCRSEARQGGSIAHQIAELALYDTKGLSRLTYRWLHMRGVPCARCTVQACQRAVAVGWGCLGSWVFKLQSSTSFGGLLMHDKDLTGICFDMSGLFMAGVRSQQEVCVFDTLTGAELSSVCVEACSVIWDPQLKSELHVGAWVREPKAGDLNTTLAFQDRATDLNRAVCLVPRSGRQAVPRVSSVLPSLRAPAMHWQCQSEMPQNSSR